MNHFIEMKNDEEFKTVLESDDYKDKLFVIDWYANWCGPCKRLYPLVSEIIKECPQDIIFLKCNADNITTFVKTLPTFHFVKNNLLIYEFNKCNFNTFREDFLEIIDKLIKNE